jgi:hypothetical protein
MYAIPIPAARAAVPLLAALLLGPPARAQAPDADMAFITATAALGDAVAGPCDRARLARYVCATLIGAQAAPQAVRSLLAAPDVMAGGVVGAGDATQVQLYGAVLDTQYFQGLPGGTLDRKVLFFTARVDAAMPAAVMAAGARTFIRARLAMPSAKSQAVFGCFWERVLLDTAPMATALSVCASAEGVEGYFSLSGDAGRFIDGMLGDKDDFHPGDAADVMPLSPAARSLVGHLQAMPGQGPGVDLDVPAQRNQVGLTHYLTVPRNFPLEAGHVELRIRMTGEVAANDLVLTNLTLPPFGVDRRFARVVALRDLLREAPVAGQTYDVRLDLQDVPTRDFSADSYSGPYDNTMKLLPIAVSQRRLDLVFSDNTTVDYSSLVLKQYEVDTWTRRLVGDQDNFHGGGAADVAPKSQHVADILAYFAATPGQGPGLDLDAAALNNPVGLTHENLWMYNGLLTSATLRARVRVTGDVAGNDVIFYNESAVPTVSEPNSSNVIALADLLGEAARRGRTYELNVNLSRVPLRARLGASYPGRPDSVRDLLGMLRAEQRLDLVFGDDTMVDYSELTLTFTVPQAPAGDLNADMLVNRRDLAILMAGLNTSAYGADDPRDLDHDGRITVLDARRLVARCSFAGCAYAASDAP